MSRCWGCCQENCGYSRCSCSCHESERGQAKVTEVTKQRESMDLSPKKSLIGLDSMPIEAPCSACGTLGAHYCVGKLDGMLNKWITASSRREELERAKAAGSQCPDHKRYQAKRKPRSACEGCWRIWIALNPG